MRNRVLMIIKKDLIRPTREYLGGMLGGVGLCLLLVRYVLSQNKSEIFQSGLIIVIAALLVCIGGSLAASGQRSQKKQRKAHNQEDAPDQ